MRVTQADLFIRVFTRYGLLLLFLALLIASLFAGRVASNQAGHLTLPRTLSLVLFFCSVVGMIVIAPAALRIGARLVQVGRAAFSVPSAVSGSYGVSSTTLELSPLPRSAPSERRPIALHIWYPAERPTTASEAPPATSAQLDDNMGLPQAARPYPLVLFAPGLGGAPSQMTLITESLASHGYVVVGINDFNS